jgi:hypothetical protein
LKNLKADNETLFCCGVVDHLHPDVLVDEAIYEITFDFNEGLVI